MLEAEESGESGDGKCLDRVCGASSSKGATRALFFGLPSSMESRSSAKRFRAEVIALSSLVDEEDWDQDDEDDGPDNGELDGVEEAEGDSSGVFTVSSSEGVG
jgi:hypothetical protein